MNPVAKGVLFSAFGVVAGYGAFSAYRQFRLIQDTDFKVVSIKKQYLSFREVVLEMSSKIGNKSDIPFEIYSQNYDVYLNNILVGKVISQTPTIIPKGGSGLSSYIISFDPSKVLKAGFIQNPLSGIMRIKGKLKTKTFGFVFSGIPIDVKIPLTDFLKA